MYQPTLSLPKGQSIPSHWYESWLSNRKMKIIEMIITLIIVFSVIGMIGIVGITMRDMKEAEVGLAVILAALIFLGICWWLVAAHNYRYRKTRTPPRPEPPKITTNEKELADAFSLASPQWRSAMLRNRPAPNEVNQDCIVYNGNT